MVDPLGRPTESCLTPFPARSSPHVGPPVVACGRAAVCCGCLLVKRHSKGSGDAQSLAFTGRTTRGYSATVGLETGVSVSWGLACTGSWCEGGVRVIRLGCEVREKGNWERLCCQVSHARRGPCPGCVVSL